MLFNDFIKRHNITVIDNFYNPCYNQKYEQSEQYARTEQSGKYERSEKYEQSKELDKIINKTYLTFENLDLTIRSIKSDKTNISDNIDISKNIIDDISIFNPYDTDEPFYIININNILDTYLRWNKNLPNVTPYYAMKCNPNPVILELLYLCGCSFDCASKNEMKQILDLTHDPNKIIFAHPCKYVSHIQYAKDNNVKLMTFDNREELYKIKKIYPTAELVLRLAVNDSYSICKFNKKYGLQTRYINDIILLIKSLELNLVGIYTHTHVQIHIHEYTCTSTYTCKYAYDIATKYDIKIKLIDIGGGFEAFDKDDLNSFENTANQINNGINDFFSNIDDIKFIAEPGRYMVQTSHTLILTIIAKKYNNNKFIYYVNDGVYGSFNCIIFDHQIPNIVPLNPKEPNTLYKSKLFGNTCDSMDEIIDEIYLPELYINDKLYVNNFGAYTTSAKSDSFNGYIVNDYKYIYHKI